MKKLIVISLALCMVLGACSKGVVIGLPTCKPGQSPKKNKCELPVGTSVPSSPSPSRSVPIIRSTKAHPQSTKPAPQPSAKPFEHVIMVRGSAGGNAYEPDAVIVYVGDIVHFKDLDPNPPSSDPSNQNAPHGHSFTSNPAGAFDSGVVGSGKTFDFHVNLPVGKYHWKCTVVPYMTGYPLDVRPRPKK